MINGCFPVIYLQENGWSWPVWLEGGEMRKEETVGERGGEKEKERKEIPALSRTRELGFLQGEEHIKWCVYIVCARLIVYLQSLSSRCVHRGGEPLCPIFCSSNPHLAPVSGNIPEQCQLCASNGKNTHDQFYIISAAKANGCY